MYTFAKENTPWNGRGDNVSFLFWSLLSQKLSFTLQHRYFYKDIPDIFLAETAYNRIIKQSEHENGSVPS